MNWFQKLIVLIMSIVLVTILGCSAWQDGLTPAYIDPAAIEYADISPTVFTPYTSLWDARRIQRELDHQYQVIQVDISRDLEDNSMRYSYLKDALSINIQSAEELRNTLFSPTGPLSLLFAAVPSLALGAYLVQRPTDKKRIKELENDNHV